MRYLFLILALQTLLFSTQPIWQTACEQWLSDCCPMLFEENGACVAMASCSASASCAAPVEGEEGEPTKAPQCCPPFQCCFISFPGFSTPYSLDFKETTEPKTQPQAYIKTLQSTYIAEFFHPPEEEVCPQK